MDAAPVNDIWVDIRNSPGMDAKDSVHVEVCVTPPLDVADNSETTEQPGLFMIPSSAGFNIVTACSDGMLQSLPTVTSTVESQAVVCTPPPGQTTHQSLMSSTQLISSDTSTTFGSDLLQDPDQSRSVPTSEQTVMSPNRTLNNKKQHVVKKIIVIQPHEDPEKATADAIEKITQSLDREAAQNIAAGKSPQKETVIEIMRIRAPSATQEPVPVKHEGPETAAAGYCVTGNTVEVSNILSPALSQTGDGTPEDRKKHRRKHVPTRYMYRTPSPPPGKVSRPASSVGHSLSDRCYFQPQQRCSSVVGTASTLLLGNRGMTPTLLHPTSSLSGVQQHPYPPSRPPSNTRLPAILRNSRQPSFEAAPPPPIGTTALQLLTKSGVVRPKAIPASMMVSMSSSDSDTSQELKEASVCSNNSLTNIQWLGSMTGEKLTTDRDLRIIATEKQIDKISKECGRKKRPPYSYMHLIQMAIYSKPDKRMTLREIYWWIEEKFAYYKYSMNQGWKNSIRHNLSLYKIFVREKRSSPGKSGTSYWTLRADVSEKLTKCMKPLLDGSDGSASDTNSEAAPSPNPVAMAASSSSIRIKKAPVPLLPKPPSVQTYALVPIQGGVPVMPTQKLMWSSVPASTGRVLTPIPQPIGTEMTSIQSHRPIQPYLDGSTLNVKRLHSPTQSVSGPRLKQIKLASKPVCLSDTSLEGWPRTDTPTELRTPTPTDSDLTGSMDSMSLQLHLSQMRFADSGIDMRLSDSSVQDLTSSLHGSSDVQKGMPKPKMYTLRGRKGKGRGKKSESSLHDEDQVTPSSSSGSEYGSVKNEVLLALEHGSTSEPALHDILSSIEKSLSSPMRNLLKTPMHVTDKNVLTSTPFKEALGSPSQWLSPIHGLTPINSEALPLGNLFTPPSEGKGMSSAFQVVTPKDKDPLRSCGADLSPKLGSSHGFSLLNLTPLRTPFKTPPQTPKSSSGSNEHSPNDSFGIMGNQSFAKLLGDISLQSMIDEGINLDVSNMSFSALQ